MEILLKCEMIIASLGDFKRRNSGQTMRIIQKTPTERVGGLWEQQDVLTGAACFKGTGP